MYPAIFGQALAAAALSTPTPLAGQVESVPRQRAELVRFVKAYNRAGTVDRDEAKARGYFHPTLQKATKNTHLAVEKSAQTVEFTDDEFHVDLFGGGQFGIVRFSYTLTMVQHGHLITHSGRKMLALVKESQRWWIVADTTDEAGNAQSQEHSTVTTAVTSPKTNGSTIQARHHIAPRWIEGDYNPQGDALIA
jgi:hypothetical protein